VKAASLVTVVVAAFVWFVCCVTAWEQKRQPPPRKGEAPILKRLAELERQLSSVLKEIQELRQDLQAAPKVTAIPVKDVDATDTARLLKEIYKGTPRVAIEALPDMRCVAIRADPNTTKEVRELLGRLEESARDGGKGPIKVIVCPPNRTDPAFLDEVIRAIQKQNSPEEKRK
jgi:hypothetical protein